MAPKPLLNKKLLVVNTGSSKKKFTLQILKNLGAKVVVINLQKNWATPYVDDWILADTSKHHQALSALEKYAAAAEPKPFDGVLTFWEDDVLLTSKIVDKYQLIGIPYDIAKTARNKFLFRQFCRQNNLPAPQSLIINSDSSLSQAAKSLSFPIVIKPTYGSSSSYVVKVNHPDDLKATYQYVKKNLSLSVESALSDGFEIMAEEYIDGNEVDIDILLQNGKLKFYSISDNFKTKEPFFVETGQAIPSTLPENDQKALLALAENVLEKLGIYNGCIHFEAKVTRSGTVPIEVNLRMGGDEVHSFVKDAWGVDLVENAALIATGNFLNIKKPTSPRKYLAGKYYLPENSGILSKFYLDNKSFKDNQVQEFHFFKKIGEPVLAPPEGFEYLGWLTAAGDNALDAQENLDSAYQLVQYEIAKYDPSSSVGKTSRRSPFSNASINKGVLLGAAKIERLRHLNKKDLKKLQVAVACNGPNPSGGLVEQELTQVGKNIVTALTEKGYQTTFVDFNYLGQAYKILQNSKFDLVFNVCERINNSSLLEPHAASLLDTLRIPYTGSNPLTLALCIDKIRVKKLLAFHNIPTPKWDYAYSLDDDIDSNLRYPLIVKPGNTDNSIGITNESVVTTPKELKNRLRYVISKLKRPALVEEYIEGDEYDVSLLGNDNDLRVLPLSRSKFDKLPKGYWHIYPFDAKFAGDKIYKQSIQIQRPPKKINAKLASLISEIAIDTYNILGCHDYGRVEVRVDKNNNPYVLELNPNPSINIGDCIPDVASLAGLKYPDFIEEIIKLAVARYKNSPPYFHLQANLI